MINKIFRLLRHTILIAYCLITLIPLVWVILSAFKTNLQIMTDPLGLPTQFNLDNFVFTWVKGNVGLYFFNSLFISSVSTIATIVFATTTAFALTHMIYPSLNKWLRTIILAGLTVPAGTLLIPLYFIVVDLKIYNTYFAMILPYIAFGLSLCIIITLAFMRGISYEMIEASIVDGSTINILFWKIIVPLCVPVLVTTFILTFISNWNEFVLAQFYIDNVKLRPLPVGMLAFRDQYTTNYTGIAVGVLYSVIPVLIVYGILQEKIISGLTAGSVKG